MTHPATDGAWLVEQFEQHRPRLRALAYRMLGSLPDAEDAVQEAWVRFNRAGAGRVDNAGALLTTISSRVCLNMLRARKARPEGLAATHVPDPVISPEDGTDPEAEALLADSVGLALMVVLDTLRPVERLAFVLHDIFDVPYAQIAQSTGRSPAAARQLASRARQQVRLAGVHPPDADQATQRSLVDAFFAAARGGDFDALVALLAPGVVLHADGGAMHPSASAVLHGPADVAARALKFIRPESEVRPILVNGTAGALVISHGKPVAVLGFAVSLGQLTHIDVITDRSRLARLASPAAGGPTSGDGS